MSHKTTSIALMSVAALAALSAGVWAVPAVLEAATLSDQAQPRYASYRASSPAAPEVTGALDAQQLNTDLNNIFEGFDGTIAASVIDPVSGEVLYARDADNPRTPASNLKILVDYTVLTTFAPTDTFTTSATYDGSTLTLVAGGDTLLSRGVSDESAVVGRAGLETLARQALDVLEAQGVSGEIAVNRDTSLFTGPSANPAWSSEDRESGFVGDVHPIALYSHSVPDKGQPTENRYPNAAMAAQEAFIEALNKLAPSGTSFILGDEAPSPEAAQQVAAVESAPVYEQSAYMMQHSDNLLSETLARASALKAGGEGSIDGAIARVEKALSDGGFTTTGVSIKDLCGLLPENKVTNTLLTEIITAMVDDVDGIAAGIKGLPIAGGSGTLAARFDDPHESGAQGFVRAKTGTLNNVLSLTGYAVTPEHQVLVFSIISNDVANTTAAKSTLDRAAATIAGRG